MKDMTLGEKIKNARVEKQLTQQAVAGNFITRNMLSKIENNLAKPSYKTIEYIAKKLDMPVSYFLESVFENLHDETSGKGSNMLEQVFEHSSFLIKNKEYSKCTSYIEEALVDFKGSESDIYYGRVTYNLGICYLNICKEADSKKKLEEAVKILQELKDYYYLSNAYSGLSSLSFKDRNFAETEDCLKKAQHFLQISYIDDVFTEIKLYYRLGYVYMMEKRYQDAIDPILHSLELSKQHNCQYNLGECYMLLGNVFFFLKKYDKSIYYLSKAAAYFEFTESYELKASAQSNLGNVYFAYQDYEKAQEQFENSLAYYIEKHDQNTVNILRCDILNCMVIKNELSKAKEYYKTIDIDMLPTSDRGVAYKLVGKIQMHENNFEKAHEYFMKAEELLLEANKLEYLSELYNTIADFYSSQGDYKTAYEYSQKTLKYKDAFYTQNNKTTH